MNESTWPRSNGPADAYGSTAARALPAKLKPTTSAPPPFRNDLRESSIAGSVVDEEVGLLAGRRVEEPLPRLQRQRHRALADEARARDRRRGGLQPLQVEGRLRRLVEDRDLVAPGLERADRLAQVLERQLPGGADVGAERAAERDAPRAHDVLRGRARVGRAR